MQNGADKRMRSSSCAYEAAGCITVSDIAKLGLKVVLNRQLHVVLGRQIMFIATGRLFVAIWTHCISIHMLRVLCLLNTVWCMAAVNVPCELVIDLVKLRDG